VPKFRDSRIPSSSDLKKRPGGNFLSVDSHLVNTQVEAGFVSTDRTKCGRVVLGFKPGLSARPQDGRSVSDVREKLGFDALKNPVD
jgi:hypothetical protein